MLSSPTASLEKRLSISILRLSLLALYVRRHCGMVLAAIQIVIIFQQSLFKIHFNVKHWAFDIAKIKSYLSSDTYTAHIGFAFSGVLGYNSVM